MRFTLALPLLFTILTSFSSLAIAAPTIDLWPYWEKHTENSEKTIDHSEFSSVLQNNVVLDKSLNLTRVRYGSFSAEDKKTLKAYIKRLEGTKITQYNRDEQYAYWINLYNAVTVDLVVSNFPVESIKEIGGGFFSGGPWDEKLITVEKKRLTLNDIEHRILRPIWKNPLTHYGVNCASIGCPNLRMEAFTGENVLTALRANAEDYINSPRGVKFEGGALQASKIYNWFAVDFGSSEQAVISHIRQFAAPKLSAKLDAASGIGGYYYDWSLNGAK